MCPSGTYCQDGVQSPCPSGRYGAVAGLSSAMCSGMCSVGYFCPPNSTSATQVECGWDQRVPSAVYCPPASGEPTQAALGEYTSGGTSQATRGTALPCPSGSFCVSGSAHWCPPGRFGCADRLSDPGCNGPCTAGFYCPLGASSSQALACGVSDRNPSAASVFCPEGASAPMAVGPGNYSTGSTMGTPHRRTGQEVCPAGSFCLLGLLVSWATAGNVECDSLCSE